MIDFLRDNIKTKKGLVTTSQGEAIGTHDGVELFTIGQRHGIGVPGGRAPFYVAEKNLTTGTLIVAEGNADSILYNNNAFYNNANWIMPVSFPLICEARIRYRSLRAPCHVYEDQIVFLEPQWAVTSGQSVVFYNQKRMLGGGVIV